MHHLSYLEASSVKEVDISALLRADQLPELIRAYDQICESVSLRIRQSGRVQKYFYLSMGMSRSTFERRMKTNEWSLKELWMLGGLLGS